MPTAAPIAMNSDARVIPGRECGSCTLCCKVYNIPEIGKAAGKWCKHCTPGKGCYPREPSQPVRRVQLPLANAGGAASALEARASKDGDHHLSAEWLHLCAG